MSTGFIADTFQVREIIEERKGLYPRVELYRQRMTRIEIYAYHQRIAEIFTALDPFRKNDEYTASSATTAAWQAVEIEKDKYHAEVLAKQIGKWDLKLGDGLAEIKPETFLRMEPELFDCMFAIVMEQPPPGEVAACGGDEKKLQELFKEYKRKREAPLKN